MEVGDDLTNISLYRLGDGHSADQHDPDCAVGYVEKIGGRAMNQMKKEELEITISDSDRIECAIRHIQTAVDVDPWAVEIAVDAMRKELSKNSPKLDKENGDLQPTCNQLAKDTNVPCKDTISRQAAISELMEWVEKEKNKSWSPFKGLFHWTGIKAMLECLPSVQPEIEERKEESAQNVQNEDLISRKAAIDALRKYIAVNKNPNHDARIWEEGMNCALTVIGALPSAQPDADMIHLQKEQSYMQGWEDGREALREEIWERGRD